MEAKTKSWKEKQILKSQQDPLAKLQCTICPMAFRLTTSLNHHIATKHNASCECLSCGLRFSKASDLTQHKREHHGGEINNINPRRKVELPSDEIVNSYILRQIVKSTVKVTYQCKECDQTFKWQQAIFNHVKRVHLRVKSFVCGLCDACFMTSNSLKEHKETVHDIKRISNEEKRAKILEETKDYYDLNEEGEPILNCKACYKSYENLGKLQKHVKLTHIKKQRVVCDLCGKDFCSKASLKEHKLCFHGDPTSNPRKLERKRIWEQYGEWLDKEQSKIRCKVCQNTISGVFSSLKRHVQDVHERDYNLHCDKCGQRFHNKANFKTHMVKMHQIARRNIHLPKEEDEVLVLAKRMFLLAGEDKIKCIVCDKVYHKRYSKMDHVKKFHLNAIHQCKTCGAVFEKSDTLAEHIMADHSDEGISNMIIDEAREDFNYDLETDDVKEENEECVIKEDQKCLNVNIKDESPESNTIQDHYDVIHEHDMTMFKCKHCPELHMELHLLTMHLRKRHQLNVGTFVCDACGQAFLHKESLTQHYKTKHLHRLNGNIESNFKKENSKWICKLCDQILAKRDQMRRHYIIVHLNEEPKICEVCGGSFTAQGLHFHMELAHYSSKLKNKLKNMSLTEALQLFQDGLQCKKCGKNFKSEQKVQKHIKNVHLRRADYECEHCDAKFVNETSKSHHLFKMHDIRSSDSQDHERQLYNIEFVKTNIGRAKKFEREGVIHYVCPLCEKVTMRSAGLRIHLRLVHLGIKSLECELCHKKFSSSGTLSYHVNFTHKKAEDPEERSRHLEVVREYTAKAKLIEKNGRNFYQCEICNKYLTGKQGLRLHLMNMHLINKK